MEKWVVQNKRPNSDMIIKQVELKYAEKMKSQGRCIKSGKEAISLLDVNIIEKDVNYQRKIQFKEH